MEFGCLFHSRQLHLFLGQLSNVAVFLRDPRLRTEIVPFVVEAHGAAGPEACRLMAITKHQFGQLVLPCEDRSSEQTFYSAWAIRISSALQRGTALMIHNIPLGNSIKSRRTKDVDIEPTAGSSGTLGGGGGGSDDDDSGQLGSNSDSEVEVSDSEAEVELEGAAGAKQQPKPNNNSNRNRNRNNSSNRNSNRSRGDNSSAVKRKACADRV